jgi:2-polyprenyl-3-methyl-5-hydroxy-6-metoxy-1,4-benzoquinol methylase
VTGEAPGSPRRLELPASLTAHGDLIERLNQYWRVAGPGPADTSVSRRLAFRVRQLLARLLGPQETFNSTVVQYINGTSAAHLDILDILRDLASDTDAALDDLRRHREALGAREHRLEAAMATIRSGQDELRTALGVLQQATTNLSRQVTALRASAPLAPTGNAIAPMSGANAPTGSAIAPTRSATPPAPQVHALSHKYVGFEDLYRGSPESIRAGLAGYVDLFAGTSDVLDIGCGRGEFLGLLTERGVPARGIDINDSMIDVCREHGLEAESADALEYLQRQPDASLGGLFAAQVVEHLEPWYLTQLLDLAFDKLRPGAPIVLETINPACWFAFFESYIRDITHVRPLHPDTLTFLLIAAGFQRSEVRYKAPYPEHDKLQPVAMAGPLTDAAETLNANVEKLNRLLFTNLDYAAIAHRP